MNYFDLSAGMEINIAVRCHRCDEGYLNTPARTPERARECAESVGWCFCGEWYCPDCAKQLND